MVVWENRPVSIRYADAADLANEPRLRKMTGREGRVRLIDIADHDLSACGGTHVGHTGEVGLIVIRGTERFRGGTRVTFLAGRRALESYRALRDTADAAARALSVAATDVPDALLRLREDLKQEQRRATEAIRTRDGAAGRRACSGRGRVGTARGGTAGRRCAGAARVGPAARLGCRSRGGADRRSLTARAGHRPQCRSRRRRCRGARAARSARPTAARAVDAPISRRRAAST